MEDIGWNSGWIRNVNLLPRCVFKAAVSRYAAYPFHCYVVHTNLGGFGACRSPVWPTEQLSGSTTPLIYAVGRWIEKHRKEMEDDSLESFKKKRNIKVQTRVSEWTTEETEDRKEKILGI